MLHHKYDIEKQEEFQRLEKVGLALASPIRLKILAQISNREISIMDLAKLNYVSVSSILFHLKILVEAKLACITTLKTNHGTKRFVSRSCATIDIKLFTEYVPSADHTRYVESQPIGGYIDAKLGTKAGIVTSKQAYLLYDEGPYIPERFDAQLFFTNYGYLIYAFNNHRYKKNKIHEISFSLEICSEAPYYNNDFKSDITFSINDIEILVFTSPGDFGGRLGKYTPKFWNSNSTQYGQLKNIAVNENGAYLDGVLVSNKIKINDLKINEYPYIKFKIESKKDAKNCGGFNIFGEKFGDYPQNIEMVVLYD